MQLLVIMVAVNVSPTHRRPALNMSWIPSRQDAAGRKGIELFGEALDGDQPLDPSGWAKMRGQSLVEDPDQLLGQVPL